MTPAEYILDPRFELIMCSVKLNAHLNTIVDGPDFGKFLADIDPKITATVTFNSLFDNSILAYRYGWVPDRMIDLLGVSRALLGHKLQRLGLEYVAEHLGVGRKGKALSSMLGKHRADIRSDPPLWREFCNYALNDNHLNIEIFRKLMPLFPVPERRIMDLVLRTCIEPKFLIDVPMLTQHVADVIQEKEALLTTSTLIGSAGSGAVTKDALMSNPKFQELLENLGVEVQYKTSPTTGKSTPAFAKTDDFMGELLEHEDTRVQALAAARCGIKSTIEETRSAKFLRVAALQWKHQPLNSMPIPLRYAGAHTLRLSGDWGMNAQNMPSSRQKKSKLRKSLVAPPGYKVVVGDLGQIEARLTAWLCGAKVLFKAFADKKDPYAILGAAIFNILNFDKNIHTTERFIGKSGVLGLGFGAAAPKFYAMVIRTARQLGMDITLLKKTWTPELASKSVDTYRRVNHEIPEMWQRLDWILANVWTGNTGPCKLGPCVISKGCVTGPGGLQMLYDDPKVPSKYDASYKFGGRKFKIYGASFLENIIQFLARIIVMNAALRIADRGFRFQLQCHDELAYIVRDAMVPLFEQLLKRELTRRPSWAKTLPLTADVGHGQSYGDAK
jgi:hypothetical protein